MTHLFSCVERSNLQELQGFWKVLSQRLFSRLSSDFRQTLFKLESNLLKLFLIHAKRNDRVDVIKQFFERMGETLGKKKEWKEWFGML